MPLDDHLHLNLLRLSGGDRARAASELAVRLGVEELIIFIPDPDTGAFVPALGFPQTLPSGYEWIQFLHECEAQGEARATLPAPSSARPLPAHARQAADRSILVLLGESEEKQALTDLLELLPLVTSGWIHERKVRYEVYSAEVARESARRAEALASALYTAHREIEAALAQAERARARFAFIAEAGALLADSLDGDATMKQLADFLVDRLADVCIIDIIDDRYAFSSLSRSLPRITDPIRRKTIEDFGKSPARLELAREVTKTGLPIFLRSREAAQMRLATMSLGAEGLIVVPLQDATRCLGTLTLVSLDPKRRYDMDDLSLASDLGRRAALALANSQLLLAAQAGMRAREEFLSIASHELRTPLSALSLSLYALEQAAKPDGWSSSPRAARLLESAVGQVKRLAKLTDNLLDVSRLASARLRLTREDFDLGMLVMELADGVSSQAADSGSPITVHFDGPVFGRWDRLRMGQVVSNLLSNAMKYGRGHPIDVSVRVIGSDAQILVRDRGVGVPADARERIFERFERAGAVEAIDGLGLGLYICRQIVEAHGGIIRVVGHADPGATFEVLLPLARDT